jgi:hypothetical protein
MAAIGGVSWGSSLPIADIVSATLPDTGDESPESADAVCFSPTAITGRTAPTLTARSGSSPVESANRAHRGPEQRRRPCLRAGRARSRGHGALVDSWVRRPNQGGWIHRSRGCRTALPEIPAGPGRCRSRRASISAPWPMISSSGSPVAPKRWQAISMPLWWAVAVCKPC